MSQIHSIELENFKGYNGIHNFSDLNADIVLITGQNGSGKTSFLHAVSLFLNGYDSKIFSEQELACVFSKNKTSRISITAPELFTKDLSYRSDKEWKEWSSPFEISRKNLNTYIARVATSFFQDNKAELANGDFLNYLTGAGNKGQEIVNWIKKSAKDWTQRAHVQFNEEKDWDDIRKNIFTRMLTSIENSNTSNELKSRFVDFKPLITNGNLAKHWQSQVANLGYKFGILAEISYGPQLLDQLIDMINNAIIELQNKLNIEKEQFNKSLDWEKQLKQLLSQLNFLGEDFSIYLSYNDEWERLKLEISSLKNKQNEITSEYNNLKNIERSGGPVEEIISVIENNLEKLSESMREIGESTLPFPDNINTLMNNILILYPESTNTPGDSFVEWVNSIRNLLAQKSNEIRDINNKIQQEEMNLQVSIHLSNSEIGKKFLAENLGECPISRFSGFMNAKSSSDQIKSPVASDIESYDGIVFNFRELANLEREHNVFEDKKRLSINYVKAEEFGREWQLAFESEMKKSGEFLRILEEIDLTPILERLKYILSIFHLPEEFISNIQLSQRGTGSKALISPTLNNLSFDNLSTGQKTIFALAWTTVLNSALQSRLGHRVMLFDDVTTSLDLNQIIPSCVLFRKLAYSSNKSLRRQLFISSHHEDLTNRLLDCLLPPEDCSMKILEFREFNVDKGPYYEIWEINSQVN
ncbi:AAA family ATPase [Leptospira santarosai]|uniref:AAA family ATPase n=1 Tax=Leptospira santarosai TaxID=28183 RepID=UPI0007749EAC|nr:AAA family ATPase [Leptospira santarosai]